MLGGERRLACRQTDETNLDTFFVALLQTPVGVE